MQTSDLTGRLVQSVLLTEFGGFDKIKIQLAELKPVSCTECEVEVKVKYCGVNFADLYLRQGLIPSVKLPCVLGLECVGIVQGIGSQVHKIKVGDRVLCYRGDGGLYRETVILHEKYCFPVPDEIEDRIAVTLPANYLTAYFSLFSVGNLKPGQKVLIHSCAGGVGWAATQLAKTVEDVTVIGTASPSKHSEVKNNGVDYVIPSVEYLKALKEDEILNGFLYDVIIDNIGGGNVDVSTSLLNANGKVVVIGANHIITGEQKLTTFQLLKSWWNTKNLSVRDLVINNWVVAGLNLTKLMEDIPDRVQDNLNQILQMCVEGKINPRIDSEYALDQITNAMEKLANRENIGKVIVKI